MQSMYLSLSLSLSLCVCVCVLNSLLALLTLKDEIDKLHLADMNNNFTEHVCSLYKSHVIFIKCRLDFGVTNRKEKTL